MKVTYLLAASAMLGVSAFAQDAPANPDRPARPARPGGPGGPGGNRPLPEAIVKKYDKDGDGKLSEEERTAMQTEMKAAREARQKEMLAKFDKDGDGKLSDEERKAANEAQQ